jgi:hypothetical protein
MGRGFPPRSRRRGSCTAGGNVLSIVQTQHGISDELAVVVAEEVVHARVVGAGAAGVSDEGEEGGEGPGGRERGGGGGVGRRVDGGVGP